MVIRYRVLALLTIAGCAVPNDPGDPPREARVATAQTIEWGACPGTDYAFVPNVECATVPMPLDHEHPDGRTVPVLVARVLSGSAHPNQLWMFDGGPGGSGEEFFLGILQWFRAVMPDTDFYVPAHRGTGYSAPLACPGEGATTPLGNEMTPAEWRQCRDLVVSEWGDGLQYFNVSNAVDDFAALIDMARQPGVPVYIYGLSYGTTVGWRYLARHPHQADAIIQDSIVSPNIEFISQADAYIDPLFQEFAGLCANDALCSSKMGPHPYEHVQQIVHDLDAGHCAEAGITHARLRQFMGAALISWDLRPAAFAVPYRLERCSADDVAAAQRAMGIYFTPTDDEYGYQRALEVNISFNELWESPPPSPWLIKERVDHELASLADWTKNRADIYPSWPKYAPDTSDPAWPHTEIPMLMINGDLDGETPIDLALAARDHYHGPHQTFVIIPNATHAAGYQSPTTRPDGIPCGIDIMGSFVHDPRGALDLSCLDELEPLTFDDAIGAYVLMDSGSFWDTTPVTFPLAVTQRTATRRMLARSRIR